MQCPVDQTTLLMTARDGVEIDYCPQCRGVWLDRGELDKLIERSDRDDDHPRDDRPRDDRLRDDRLRDDRLRDDRPRYEERPYQKPRKKKWLSEMFDFD